MELHATKVVECNNCGEDVIINASYPIDSVDQCKNCGLYDWNRVNRAEPDEK